MKTYYQENKEKIQQREKIFHKKNPRSRADKSRKHRYGITPEEYNIKTAEQDNKCAICGNLEVETDFRTGRIKFLLVDHNHTTKKNRDLLCQSCNRALGQFKEDISILQKAIQYLEKHKG
jgi:recombination endonuclease VII